MKADCVITIWDRWDENRNGWGFNHISDGWTDDEKPVPRGENQEKSWPFGKWKKTKAQLIKGVVVAD